MPSATSQKVQRGKQPAGRSVKQDIDNMPVPAVDYSDEQDAPFDRAYIVPRKEESIEKFYSPRGNIMEEVQLVNSNSGTIILLEKMRRSEGKVVPIEEPYFIPIPGRTDDNAAIRDRQRLSDVNRALYFNENNGVLYDLIPISKEEYAEEQKMRRDGDFQSRLRDRLNKARPNVLVDQRVNGVPEQSADEAAKGDIAERALKSIVKD